MIQVNSFTKDKIRSESSYLFTKSIVVKNLNIDSFIKYISYNVSVNSSMYVGEMYLLDIYNIKDEKTESLIKFYRDVLSFATLKNIIIIGIKNCNVRDKKTFNDLGIGVYIDNKDLSIKTAISNIKDKNLIDKTLKSESTKIFDGVLRSGDQIENKEGDVVIIGSLNDGAVVKSSGNIIIIGSAMGSIYAGTLNPESFIYAVDFKATIVSINGSYKTIEDNSSIYKNKNVLIRLKSSRLIFTVV